MRSLPSILALIAVTTPAVANEPIVLLPSSFTLHGTEARQTLLLQVRRDDGAFGPQVREGIKFTTSDPQVVRIDEGTARPVGDGRATITARVGERSATAEVEVVATDEPHRWSFRNHVQSVLSKTGCNSGACHGAAAGKNGFELSLRGYDPEADFFTITRQARGRRIVAGDPARSLILTKPSGAIPHKGGLRFEVGSREYQAIAEWIAAGQPAPRADDPRIVRLEILPPAVELAAGDEQQFCVRAHFDDGRIEDVTTWAKFTATNLTVAKVDDVGLVEATGHGEGTIVAWYLAQNAVATVTSPSPHAIAPEEFTRSPRRNFIDEHVLAKLQSLRIPPSGPATDAEFLRRASLDVIGVLPTVEETRTFLADESPDKRDRLIESLLARPEYVDYWTYKWSDLLLVTGKRLRPKAVDAFSGWIREQVEKNVPWDEFARRIVTSKGSTYDNGAVNFFALHQDPLDMAETTSMAFLGMSIQCAKCHDHPLEKWTNDQYYGMANLFARVRGKGWGGDFRSGDGLRVVFTAEEGELIQPRTGRPQPPRPLDGTAIPFDDPHDRREHLADWLVSPENPYFSRAISNRVWANFLGTGLVEAVDDMRLTNPASNEPLLNALAAHLVEHEYDLKELMRTILQSATYQRSSVARSDNAADDRFYSRYPTRRLSAEVLLDALSQTTGAPTEFKDQAKGTRALQLRDAGIDSYFLDTFGRPERIITCECERSAEPSMVQVLHLVNGDTLNQKLAAKENRITRQLADDQSDAEIIEEAYLACLTRPPTDAERTALTALLAETKDDPANRRAAIEDLYWSILTSREFLFAH